MASFNPGTVPPTRSRPVPSRGVATGGKPINSTPGVPGVPGVGGSRGPIDRRFFGTRRRPIDENNLAAMARRRLGG